MVAVFTMILISTGPIIVCVHAHYKFRGLASMMAGLCNFVISYFRLALLQTKRRNTPREKMK